jgi:hypothetical protein
MSDLDKGLDPLLTVSKDTLLELISLLLIHARSLGKDSLGNYKLFCVSSIINFENRASIGQHSIKRIESVCHLLTTIEYDEQFEMIIVKKTRGEDKLYYRYNNNRNNIYNNDNNNNEIIVDHEEVPNVLLEEDVISVVSSRYNDDISNAGESSVSGSVVLKAFNNQDRLFLSDNEDTIGDDEDPNEISADCSTSTDHCLYTLYILNFIY